MIVESAVARALFIKIIEENLMNIKRVRENLKSDNFPSNMGTLLHNSGLQVKCYNCIVGKNNEFRLLNEV